MLVSIVTPSFNQAQYIEDTIQSVFVQEYLDLEYIIVDGGSTDGSQEIIRNYSDQLAWWVSERDEGQSQAINKGLRRAKGDVVAWLNSDDVYLPGAIHAAVAGLQEDPAITIGQEGRMLNRLSFGDWSLTELMRFHIICQPGVFMRRSALEQAGYLDEDYHFMLDHQLWLRIAAKWKIKYIDDLWAAARHHPAAKNVSQSAAFSEEIFRIIEWMKTDPQIRPRFEEDKRRIFGGANRLSGRYLLDGGMPVQALRAYSRALIYWPSYAIKHWGRMVFALANIFGFGNLEDWSRRQAPQLQDHRLLDWPGINMENEG